MIHFSISKNELFELINKSFTDSIQLLEAVKKDFHRMSVFYNGNKEIDYIIFLQKIINYPDLLHIILLSLYYGKTIYHIS